MVNILNTKPVAGGSLPPEQPQPMRRVRPKGLLEKDTAIEALKQAFIMLRPDIQWKNPVMFVVEVGAILTLVSIVAMAFGWEKSQVAMSYFVALDIWLFLTVLFANFATALAEARGRAQANLSGERAAIPWHFE